LLTATLSGCTAAQILLSFSTTAPSKINYGFNSPITADITIPVLIAILSSKLLPFFKMIVLAKF
jgi:hypothetical protein